MQFVPICATSGEPTEADWVLSRVLEGEMNIFYIIGVVVVILIVLAFLGLR